MQSARGRTRLRHVDLPGHAIPSSLRAELLNVAHVILPGHVILSGAQDPHFTSGSCPAVSRAHISIVAIAENAGVL